MDVKDFTYAELNNMFSSLIEKHADDTRFISAESAELFSHDELISGDYLCVQNAYDDLAEKVNGLKDIFDWSCGISANSYDVGLIHRNLYDFQQPEASIRSAMILAECSRRNLDLNTVREFLRISEEMQCAYI